MCPYKKERRSTISSILSKERKSCIGRKKPTLEKLLEIGAIEFFLMHASRNVNWEGSTTGIPRDKLSTIAAAIKREFRIELNSYDINLAWAELRALWETWVRSTHYVPSETVKAATGEIDISEYKWNQLLWVSIFFSVHATFSLLSASFLDMFVAFFFFNIFFFFFNVFCFVFMDMPC